MNQPTSTAAAHQAARMERYYRFHALIYDATRWSFLFGRQEIIQMLSLVISPARILEVGCGTGQNLIRLRQAFPRATLTGLDVSASMLKVARKNLGPLAGSIRWLHQAYDRPLTETSPENKFDLILFSYSLSMMNPGWEQAIEAAYHDLKPGGRIAVVDFHDSNYPLFKWLMRFDVRLNGHLLPKLLACFQTRSLDLRPAYGGFWHYLLFVGVKHN